MTQKMLNVSDGSTSAQQASSKRLSQIVRGDVSIDLPQSCQPLGRWILGGCGLGSIVTSENEFLRVSG
jgi:hypothetical protein